MVLNFYIKKSALKKKSALYFFFKKYFNTNKHEIFEIMMLENIKITNYNNVIKYIFTIYK